MLSGERTVLSSDFIIFFLGVDTPHLSFVLFFQSTALFSEYNLSHAGLLG